MRRDWTHAREKVDAEGECRGCGRDDRKLEAAHILGRVADRYEPIRLHVCGWVKSSTGKEIVYHVHPDRVVPLCGPHGDPLTCHGKFDNHELDLLGKLTPEEEAQLVMDAGSLELGRKRVYPSSYENKVAVA